MKKYVYDNQKRVPLSKRTWKRLKKYKKLYKHKTMEDCIIEMLDAMEYNIPPERGC